MRAYVRALKIGSGEEVKRTSGNEIKKSRYLVQGEKGGNNKIKVKFRIYEKKR